MLLLLVIFRTRDRAHLFRSMRLFVCSYEEIYQSVAVALCKEIQGEKLQAENIEILCKLLDSMKPLLAMELHPTLERQILNIRSVGGILFVNSTTIAYS